MTAAQRAECVSKSAAIRNFEAGEIEADQFDHEAHVYLGWLYVNEFPLAHAIERFENALQNLVRRLGAPGKYHATITWFFLILIKERALDDEPWPAFRTRNNDLLTNSKSVIERYYSTELLASQPARERFLLPDKLVAARHDVKMV